MPRGGYRKPPARTGPGGPGKFSQRSDGLMQPPPLDAPDMEYGDVRRLREAMQTVPPAGGAPRPGGPQPQTRPQGSPVGSPGSMPPFLLEHESGRPEEPVTSGLDMGAGPGSEVLMSPEAPPDLREIVLEYLYWTYDNKDAFDLLYQLREERAAKGQQGPVPEAISRPSRTQQEVGAEEEEAPPEL